MPVKDPVKISFEDWLSEGQSLFGKAFRNWRFVCPMCKHEQSGLDFKEKTDLSGEQIARVFGFSCIGRWIPGSREAFESSPSEGPCNYAGGGLFRLNPVHVEKDGKVHEYFEFAKPKETNQPTVSNGL